MLRSGAGIGTDHTGQGSAPITVINSAGEGCIIDTGVTESCAGGNTLAFFGRFRSCDRRIHDWIDIIDRHGCGCNCGQAAVVSNLDIHGQSGRAVHTRKAYTLSGGFERAIVIKIPLIGERLTFRIRAGGSQCDRTAFVHGIGSACVHGGRVIDGEGGHVRVMIAGSTGYIAGVVRREIAVDMGDAELLQVGQHGRIDEHLVERLGHAQVDIAVGCFWRLGQQNFPQVLQAEGRVVERAELVGGAEGDVVRPRVDVQIPAHDDARLRVGLLDKGHQGGIVFGLLGPVTHAGIGPALKVVVDNVDIPVAAAADSITPYAEETYIRSPREDPTGLAGAAGGCKRKDCVESLRVGDVAVTGHGRAGVRNGRIGSQNGIAGRGCKLHPVGAIEEGGRNAAQVRAVPVKGGVVGRASIDGDLERQFLEHVRFAVGVIGGAAD